jgi:hypothetical protein
MEEIMTLRRYLEEKRYDEAMIITIELENMSYDDKILRVMDFAELILLQLIKQDVEKRSARSWERSIGYALSHLVMANKKHRTGGYYLGDLVPNGFLKMTAEAQRCRKENNNFRRCSF